MAVEKFTYAGDPSKSPRDAVRFHSGDTDREFAELDDREIDYALTKQPNNALLAAAILLDHLAAKYSRKADFTVGDVSKSLGDRAKEFRARANDLRNEAGKLAVPFFGGLTKTGKDVLNQDADAVQPSFAKRQFDSPLAHEFDDDPPDPNLGQL